MEQIAPYEYIPEREKDVIVPEHKRKSKRTHEEAFENLPVEEVIHEEVDKECPDCGEQMETVGKEFVRDELVYVPARLFVRKHYAEVVKCPVCGEDESLDALYADVPAPVFKKATPPAPMIPHSFPRAAGAYPLREVRHGRSAGETVQGL